ncbi:hypothetical protein [Maricaulis sp. CAU 1757]
MGFVTKTLVFLAALFSFIVSALDLAERVGIDLAWLYARLPDVAASIAAAYAGWIEAFSKQPEIAEMSREMAGGTEGYTGSAAVVGPMPLIISATIAVLLALFLVFVVPRFYSRD